MFEEDFERCFICQTPCKGLYCSSECRLQDKGTPLENVRPHTAVRLTSKLPDSLSPLIRPIHHIAPSPRMPPQTDTSSASSISSSPLHSPRTNPSGGDSPQKEIFDLPPPAFPSASISFSGSIPVKIPPFLPKAKPASPHPHSPAFPSHTPASHSAVYPIGGSIETIRFGRKPSVTNSITSPNALIARCACGKPANHKGRPKEFQNDMDSGFSRLSLGPTVLQPLAYGDKRHVSEGQIEPSDRHAISGHTTPQPMSGSYLSRSRSDPAPLIPGQFRSRQPAAITPQPAQEALVLSSARRSTSNENKPAEYQRHRVPSMSRSGSGHGAPKGPVAAVTEGASARGRSRDRVVHPREDTSVNRPTDREVAPSRSRHRREERPARESREEAIPSPAPTPRAPTYQAAMPMDPPQIMPSWSKRPEDIDHRLGGEGVAPAGRKGASGTTSPTSPVGLSPKTSPKLEDDRESRRTRTSRVFA